MIDNMIKTEIKHIDELDKASRIIKELGYEPDETMCDDRPDICLPSKDNRLIGIEVVAYSTHRYEESENALYKILNEYIVEKLDKKSNKRYEMGVSFTGLGIPTNINYKKVKEQIFKEIETLMLFPDSQFEGKYIESITAFENPGVEHSFIGPDTIVEYDDLDEKTLLDCINSKEQKLKGYRVMEENKTIKEYYLVIFFPTNEHAEVRGYKLPNSFETKYDRIYLVDSFNYINRIK